MKENKKSKEKGGKKGNKGFTKREGIAEKNRTFVNLKRNKSWREPGRMGEEGDKKIIKMYYAHVQIPQDKSLCTAKVLIKIFKYHLQHYKECYVN